MKTVNYWWLVHGALGEEEWLEAGRDEPPALPELEQHSHKELWDLQGSAIKFFSGESCNVRSQHEK